MQFSPKILGPNVGMFGTVFEQSRIVLEDWFWVPRLMSSGFVVRFGVWGNFWPNLEMVK